MTALWPATGWRPGVSIGIAVAIAVSLIAGGAVSASSAAQLTSQEERGKRIFLEGSSPGGEPLFAFVGRNSTKVPASLLPCSSCHGGDATGRPEGGVEPSNITWRYLTKSYGHRHTDGRAHPAFDDRTLATAITGGRDPAGNRLDLAMPRYGLPKADLAAVIAYLKRLESDLDPGITETTISVATVLPTKGPFASLGQAVREVLTAYFEELNTQGGIYGRTIELTVLDYSYEAESTVNRVKRLLETEPAFAVLGAFSAGIEIELFDLLEDYGVPIIGPFTLFAGDDRFQNDLTFHILAGLPDQARALLDHAKLNLRMGPTASVVIVTKDDVFNEVARVLVRQARARGWPEPRVLHYSGELIDAARRVAELKEESVEAVFYFGPGHGLDALAAEAVKAGWTPRLFLSGELSARAAFALPAAFDGRVLLAYPTIPSDRTERGAEAFSALHDKYELPRESPSAQVSAYAAARVFAEGLRRAGRDLSRDRFLVALEGLAGFETGLTRPVSFGPNRRVGTLGAHVVAIDLANRKPRARPDWIELDY